MISNPDALQVTLVELPSGKLLRQLARFNGRDRSSPDMPYWVMGWDLGQLAIVRRGAKDPVVLLGIDVRSSGSQHQFNVSGTRYAWGNVDGTVSVADLPAIQRRLAGLGLGWR